MSCSEKDATNANEIIMAAIEIDNDIRDYPADHTINPHDHHPNNLINNDSTNPTISDAPQPHPSAELNNIPIQIDMTEAVEHVMDRIEKNHENAIEKLNSTLSEQISKLTESFGPLITALSRNAGKLPAETEDSRNTDETSVDFSNNGHNTGKLPIGRGSSRARPPCRRSSSPPLDDGKISLLTTGSQHSIQSSRKRSRSRSASYQAARSMDSADSHQTSEHRSASPKPPAKDPEQAYWEHQVAEYEENLEFGPEVSSSIASASKVFWTKSLSEEKEKRILEQSKVPENCQFMVVKLVNKEIWSSTASEIRSKDWSLQKIQATHVNMSANVLQAASDLDAAKSELKRLAVENPSLQLPSLDSIMDRLRDTLKLAGRTNQKLNDYRRESFKPSIPKTLHKLVEKPEKEDSLMLFGDDLKTRMDDIKGDNSLKKELEKPDYNSYQRKGGLPTKKAKVQFTVPQTQNRSNWQAPLNTQSGSSQGYKPRTKITKFNQQGQQPSNRQGQQPSNQQGQQNSSRQNNNQQTYRNQSTQQYKQNRQNNRQNNNQRNKR